MDVPIFKSSEKGAVLILTAISLVALLSMAAVAVDLGILYVATQQAQNTADAAALAGAGKLREGMDPDAAIQEAILAATNNAVLNDSVALTLSDVQAGAWDDVNKQVIGWDPAASGGVAVQVTVRLSQDSPNGPVPTFFAQIFGRDFMEVSRTAIAGLLVNVRARDAVCMMLVQDGSGSFQYAWSQAVEADRELLMLINGVSISDDMASMVAFNARDPDDDRIWRDYPGANQGIKYTTDSRGRPLRVNELGEPDPNGVARPMAGNLTAFESDETDELPTDLDNLSQLINNGRAAGYTDTSAGLNYAIDQLVSGQCGATAQKTIVLVSDGVPHAPSGRSRDTRALKRAAVAAADRAEGENIRIHTVTLEGTEGVSFDFNEGLIRNGGYALRAADADDMSAMMLSIGAIEIGHPSLLK